MKTSSGRCRETLDADDGARRARRLMVDGAGDGLVVAAGRPADEQRVVGRRGFRHVLPKALGRGAVAEQDTVGAVSRLAKKLLRDGQLVLQLLVAPAKLLLEIANRQVRPDPGEHFLRLERLGHEIDAAELETAHLVARTRSARRGR